jgi:hypothetical protein
VGVLILRTENKKLSYKDKKPTIMKNIEYSQLVTISRFDLWAGFLSSILKNSLK